MKKSSNILLLGGDSCLGLTIKELLIKNKFKNIFTDKKTNIFNLIDMNKLIKYSSPDYIFHLYGDSGSLRYNIKKREKLFYNNYEATKNLIHSLEKVNFKKIIFISSSCIYPMNIKKPQTLNNLFKGMPEPSSLPYALAKMTSMSNLIKFKKDKVLIIIPSTIYGVNDHIDPDKSHVLGALIAKIHLAKVNNKKELTLYGTGKPIRDFIFSEELSSIILYLAKSNINGVLNISDPKKIISIRDLSKKLKKIIGYNGKIFFDNSFDGAKYKTLKTSFNKRKYFLDFDLSLHKSYQWYKSMQK